MDAADREQILRLIAESDEALVAALVWQLRRVAPAVSGLPPISVLKPLCGDEPDLYQNLVGDGAKDGSCAA